MAQKSNIQWTDATWNIARGCTKVDEDCKFCYMYRDSFDNTRYNPLQVTKTKTVFNLPLKIKEPSKIFTSSLTDVFHPDCDAFRNEMWDIIRKCPQHTFQILTKRPERIADNLPKDWNENFKNVWLGTSIGSNNSIHRMYQLVDAFFPLANGGKDLRIPKRFISFEPLHAPIDVEDIELRIMCQFDWIIIGGESGNETGKYRYRPCKIEWMEDIINAFPKNVKVFVKQMGTHLAKELGMSDRHGGNIDEFPSTLQIREFPKR